MDKEFNIAQEHDMEELHRRYLKDLHNYPNNFSFWFPKVKDCGIRVPKSVIVPVPDELLNAFSFENEGDKEKILAFIQENIIPALKDIKGLPFIKNGCFSNKFNFATCCPADTKEETLFKSISEIQYMSFMHDTMGNNEIIIRERIPSPETMPRIYNGMPLNTEFRVFYDFNSHSALYIMNYWDKGYCRDTIASHNEEDGKAYDARYPSLLREYQENAKRVLDAADKALKGVTGLEGIWSVDFLLDTTGELWLIDMAIGRQSAYWDPVKTLYCKNAGKIEILLASTGIDTPYTQHRRDLDLRAMRLYNDPYYNLTTPTAIVAAYVRLRIGKEIDVKDAQYFGIWEFIDRELPKTKENEMLVIDANQAEKRLEDETLPEEKRKYFQDRWDRITDVLFALAMDAFLNKEP